MNIPSIRRAMPFPSARHTVSRIVAWKSKGTAPTLTVAILILSMFVLSGCATQAQRTVPPLTVSSIIQQSHDGVPAGTIIQEIAESGTVYRLKASELADLRDEGVPNTVIDYMQQTYLDAIRRDQSLADQDLWVYGPDGYWYGGYPFGWPYYYVPYTPVHEHHEHESKHHASAATSSHDQSPGDNKSAQP